MIVFANTITSRLQYIFDFIGREIIGEPFQITDDPQRFKEYNGPRINYSKTGISDFEFHVSDSGLLCATGILPLAVGCLETNNYKAFFKTDGDFPFDMFAASFYLLSRYEEYLPHKKDVYGRYAHENSLAFKENFLHLPLINIWIRDFKLSLKRKFPSLHTHELTFNFLPTYDIDEAYSYKHKQWWRTVGGFAKSIVRGQWSALTERKNVLLGRQSDPYDAFEWMDRLNRNYSLKPIYFFLVASSTAKYDKNTLPSKGSMQRLIRTHSEKYEIGIHPSWQSGSDDKKLKQEISEIGHIAGSKISASRQHYIRFNLPTTYRKLIQLGIEKDFSMGYGSINGFRASVATPFYWYDLEAEKQTGLLVYPFCFMEANSFYEQQYSAQQAFEELKRYYSIVKSVDGFMVTIWHNNFLGTGMLSKEWKQVYEDFVSQIHS